MQQGGGDGRGESQEGVQQELEKARQIEEKGRQGEVAGNSREEERGREPQRKA